MKKSPVKNVLFIIAAIIVVFGLVCYFYPPLFGFILNAFGAKESYL